MALIKCPECGKEISDKASACPNCGYPIAIEIPLHGNIDDEEEIILSDNMCQTLDDKKIKKADKLMNESNECSAGAFVLIIVGVVFLFINSAIAILLFTLSVILFFAKDSKNKNLKNFLGDDYEEYMNLKKLETESKQEKINLNNQSKSYCCPFCGSSNLTFSINTIGEMERGRAEIRKKSAVTRSVNNLGRATMTMATGGLWLLTPKRSKYKEVKKTKTVYNQEKIAICQSCGKDWTI